VRFKIPITSARVVTSKRRSPRAIATGAEGQNVVTPLAESVVVAAGVVTRPSLMSEMDPLGASTSLNTCVKVAHDFEQEVTMDDEIFSRMMPLSEPELHEPVLVYCLEGWIDAGLGASTAMTTLLDAIHTEPLATFDTDYFIDQRARRPLVRIIDGVTTELTWPEIQLRWGRDRDGADILFLVGPEPDFHWSDFVEAVTDAALTYNVRLALGLGAFPAPTPHTRPVRIIGTAPENSAHLLNAIGTVSGELEVPAGINSALELGFADVDIDVVTLWARVPHYVASMPYPQASAGLIEGLARLGGLTLDASSLRLTADEARARVDDLVANNPEHSSMVAQLEEVADEDEGHSLGDIIPSGDELAAELEQFLRGEGL